VLSTYPSDRPCARARFDNGAKYCYLQGTSMAGPHAVGVAALIKALRPNLSGGALGAAVQQAVTPLACPDASIYANFAQPGGFPQTCDGGVRHISFYGSGEVNALTAVS
jgi:subtilisin family serine protease